MNKYKLKAFIFLTLAVSFSVLMFRYPSVFSEGVQSGLSLCVKTIIPSLFPFMVVSEFLVLSGTGSAVGEKLTALTRLIFKLPGCTSCVIMMSLIGGFPVGAGMTARLVEEKYITKQQGRSMLMFCLNCGPAFSVSAVGIAMLGSKKIGIIIYTSLVISSLSVGFVTRFFGKGEADILIKTRSDINGGAIISSVKNSVNAMLSICAWVVLFSCVGSFVDLLPMNEKMKAVIFSLFEVTNGCKTTSDVLPVFAIAGVIGWSGFAVHCQVYEHLKKCEMPYGRFLLGRLLNSITAMSVCFGLLKLFHCETNVVLLSSKVIAQPYSVSLPSAVAVIMLVLFLIADNDLARNKQVCYNEHI